MIYKNYKLKYFFILNFCLFLIIIKYESILLNLITRNKKRNIGIVGYPDTNNVGNQLLKYSMNILLKRFGFNPILISLKRKNVNTNFLKKHLKIKQINNFNTDIKINDFNYLIVNSDQVWAFFFKYILEIGFLSFAENWNIKKFVYAASFGFEYWNVTMKIINSAKKLIKQFSGVSVREEQSIEIINKYLGIRPEFVLDPTFLIEKDDYLKIVENFEINIDKSQNYLCSYILDQTKVKDYYIQTICQILNYRLIDIKVEEEDFVEKFIFSINICKVIITDSFHGSVFSIIFNKPFLTFINKERGSARFYSLAKIFNIENRFIYPRKFELKDLDNFTKKLIINYTNFFILKEKSIHFIKKNLEIEK